MHDLDDEVSAEIDGQLFIVLSALTDGESFDIVMSAGGDNGFESWRKLHKRWDPYTAGRPRSLSREILSPSRVKLPELMRGIERIEDLVRRYCGRRDAQGNVHTLAEDIRMNRARLTSYGILREEITTYCECRGHTTARNTKEKRFVTARVNKAKASMARAREKGSKDKDNKDNKDRTRARTRARTRIRTSVETVESVDTTWKMVGARRTTKMVRKASTKTRMQRTLTTLTPRNQQKLNPKLRFVDSI